MRDRFLLPVATLLVTCFLSNFVNAQFNSTTIKDLKTLLFTTNNYDKTIRPEDTVNVSTTLGLYTLNKLDIKQQVMDSVVFVQFVWKDSRLDWSANSQYNSTSDFFTNEKYAWVPKVTIVNAVDDVSVITDENIPIQVFQDGTLVWITGRIVQTHCECDVRWYPFDTQTCSVSINTWGYYRAQIELNIAQPSPVLLNFYHENGEWEYIDYSTGENVVTLSPGAEFKDINFYLKFRRRPTFYFLNYILPGLLLACLLCVAFKLPAESGEKVGYTLTVLLTFTLYLSIVLDNIPTTSQRTSLLGLSMIFSIVVSVIAAIITIFVLRCHNARADEEIPKWLIKFTEKVLNRMICCKQKGCFCSCCSKTNQIDKINCEIEKPSKMEGNFVTGIDEQTTLTWKDIGRIIDAVCFKIFLFICILSLFITNMIFLIAYFSYS